MTALDRPDLFAMLSGAAPRRVLQPELTQACLERIERLEPRLHAFITLTPELALRAGRSRRPAVADWRRDDPATPPAAAAGHPLAVKDVLCVEGVRCTCGSRILENFVPPYTATAVAAPAARRAWWCWARPTPTSSPWAPRPKTRPMAPTHNPWDLDARAGRLQRRQRGGGGGAHGAGGRWAPTPAAACASRPPSAA